MAHESTDNHRNNVEDMHACYSTIPENLEAIEDVQKGTIVAFEGENVNRCRVFCLSCFTPMDSRPSIVLRHVNGPRHKINVGAKMNSVDEVIAKYANQIQRNPDHHDDIDCLVCDKQLKQIGAKKLMQHVTSAKHVNILKQSSEYDAFISPFVPNKPFAMQREQVKIQKMKNIASRHAKIEVRYDTSVHQYKYCCNTCNKNLLGRDDHLLDHHVNSLAHLRFEKSSDGTTLDDFLYGFFTVLVKGNFCYD